ncbi:MULTISPECIES: MerR family transcriptional regulator [unclassified Lacticaseibacillus]|uniref:MerR family transcriptional regulator n=1 Tax=unclassified Lacticaseibacillus TaxID=2759744 RepID=UPI001EF27AF9|nr:MULTISPECIES: MerR family transcriptional regulator [unclassified Lacticaseibacillus]
MDEFKRQVQDLDVSMGIGETSRVTGATATQIRYWEKKGIVHPIRHGEGQNKRYSYRDIVTISFVKSMIDQGYTLAKAEQDAATHFTFADALQMIVKERVHLAAQTAHTLTLNFGPLDNDPGYDVVAEVGDQVTLKRVPHQAN